jgi:hypothetical protein
MAIGEADQKRLYEETHQQWMGILKRLIWAKGEERQHLIEERDRLKQALDGYEFNPPDTNNNLENEARPLGGERGGKLYGASHIQKSEDGAKTLVIDLAEIASGVDATKSAKAGSAPTQRQARPASPKTPITDEGSRLMEKRTVADQQRLSPNPRNIVKPNAGKVDEYANACVRMFNEDDAISTKKKCASKIHKALAVGIDAETILFEIEDSAQQGEKPLNLFCWRMNKRIGEALSGVDRSAIRRGAPAN